MYQPHGVSNRHGPIPVSVSEIWAYRHFFGSIDKGMTKNARRFLTFLVQHSFTLAKMWYRPIPSLHVCHPTNDSTVSLAENSNWTRGYGISPKLGILLNIRQYLPISAIHHVELITSSGAKWTKKGKDGSRYWGLSAHRESCSSHQIYII